MASFLRALASDPLVSTHWLNRRSELGGLNGTAFSCGRTMAPGAVRDVHAGGGGTVQSHPRRRRSPHRFVAPPSAAICDPKTNRSQPRTRKPSRSWRVSTPTGLPSSCTSTASACSRSLTASVAVLGRADGRHRRRHVLLDRVGEQGLAGEQLVEQHPVGHRAGDLGRDDRRLGADHGHLRHVVLLEDVHRLGDRLAGVGVHQVGQLAGLAAQDLARRSGRPGRSRRPGSRTAPASRR